MLAEPAQGFFRRARFASSRLLGAALLAAAALALPVQAQAVLLVGNATGTADTTNGPAMDFSSTEPTGSGAAAQNPAAAAHVDPFIAQEFTTGANSEGYLLESVEIFWTGAGNPAKLSKDDIPSISVCPVDTSGDPNQTSTDCKALTPPTGLLFDSAAAATTGHSYTAPMDTTLSTSTTYSLYISGMGSGGRLHVITTGGPDSGGQTDWSLASTYQILTSGTWSDPSSNAHPLKVKINGTVRQLPVLISNAGQTTSSDFAALLNPTSQEFTTGTNPGGYLLRSVDTYVNGSRTHTLAVCPLASGDPDTSNCDALTPPTAFQEFTTGPNTFTASPGVTLSASTTYSLYMTSSSTSNSYQLASTDDEDDGGATGWSLADAVQQFDGSFSTWNDIIPAESLRVTIRGTAKSGGGANNAPVFSPDTRAFTLAENTATAINVGMPVTATDADPGDTLSYTLSGTDSLAFTIDGSTAQIKTKAGQDFNFEAKSSYTLTVTASDGTDTDTATVTITLTNVTGEVPSAPAAPTVNMVTGSTSNLTVSWSAPTNAGPAITGYGVRWCKGTLSACTTTFTVTGSLSVAVTTEATITGLEASTEYQVQVRAANGEGEGAWSGSGGGTTNAPVNVAPAFAADAYTREVPENSGADVNVGAAITATDGNNDTLTYTLESGMDAASFTIVGTSGQIRTKSGVTYDRETRSMYTVTIKADDSNGGTDTATVTITLTNVAELPLSPGEMMVDAVSGSDTSLTVSWSPAMVPSGAPPVTGYDVRYCKGTGTACDDDAEFTGTHAFSGTGTETTITGIDAATTYQVRVRATNADGAGPWIARGGTTTTPTLTVGYGLTELAYAVEGEDGVAVEVTLSAAPGREVTIPLTRTTPFRQRIPFTGVPSNLTFGATQTSRTFTMTVPDNNQKDVPPEVWTFGFGSSLPAGITAPSGAGSTATVTTLDDDFTFRTAVAGLRSVVVTGNGGPTGRVRVGEAVGTATISVSMEMIPNTEMSPTELAAAGLDIEFEMYTHSEPYPAELGTGDLDAFKAIDRNRDGGRWDYVGFPASAPRTLTVVPNDFTYSEFGDCLFCSLAEFEITIQINNDLVDENTERFTLVMVPDYEGVSFGQHDNAGAETPIGQTHSPVEEDQTAMGLHVEISDDDPAPTPTLELSKTAVSESDSASDREVTVTVTMPGSQYRVGRTLIFPNNVLARRDRRLTLVYTMGTAEEGTDFTATGTHVSIPARSSANAPGGVITVTDDVIDDADTETIVVDLMQGDRLMSSATITVTDDDSAPTPMLTADRTSVGEGDADLTVDLTVTMPGGQYAAATELMLTFTGTATAATDTLAGDFSAPLRTLTIAARSDANVAAGTLTMVDDRYDEPAETITAWLFDAAAVLTTTTTDGGGTVTTTTSVDTAKSLSSVEITLNDNDPAPAPSISFNQTILSEDVSDYEYESLTDGTLTLNAGSAPSFNPRMTVRFPEDGSVYETAKTLTLDYSSSEASAGTDYLITHTSVQIRANSDLDVPAGQVAIVADQLDEDPELETLVVELKDGTTLLSSATVTIVDDDDPPVVVEFAAAAYTAAEGGADAVVEVTISDDPERTLELPLTQSGDADGDGLADWSGVPTAVTFTASTTQADWVRSFTVTATDDDIDDDGESVTLGFLNIMAQFALEDQNVSFGTTSAATVSLTDDDERGVTLSEPPQGAASLEIDEADAAVTETYTVVLDSQPTAEVTVALTVASDTVLPTLPTASPTSLTFTTSNWNTEQTVTVTVPADNDSVNEAASITHDVSGGDYAAIADLMLSVDVDDDEEVPTGVTLTAAPAGVSEGQGRQSVVITATLDNAALKEEMVLRIRSEAGAMTEDDDFVEHGFPAILRLTVDAQQFSGTSTIGLEAVDDLLFEPEAETYVVTGVVVDAVRALNRTGEVDLFGDVATPASIPLVDNDPIPDLELTTDRSPAALSEQDDPATTDLDERIAEVVLSITNGVGFEHEQTVSLAFGSPAGAMAPIRGTDYTDDAPSGDTLTLGAGVVSAAATVTLTGVNDDEDEDNGTPGPDVDDEMIEVTGTHGDDTIGPLVLHILDDDHPVVTVRYSAESYTATEGGADAVVAMEIDVPPGNDGPERDLAIPVTQSIADGEVSGQASAADYSGVPATVTFPAVGLGAQEFTVTATDDAVDDDGETVTLDFGPMPDAEVSATPPAGATTQATATELSLVDDDARGLVFAPPVLRASDIGEGSPGNGDFTVALASEPTADVTVTWGTPDLLPRVKQGQATVTSTTFTPANWNQPQQFKVIPGIDGNGVHDVEIWTHRTAGGDYEGFSDEYTVQVLDQNRDVNSVLLAAAPEQVAEGETQTITVTAFGAALTVATTVSLTVGPGTAAAADFTASPGSLEIVVPANTASATGTFSLTATDDSTAEDDETVTVSGTATAAGLTATLSVESADVTIEDDDVAGVTLSENRLDDLPEGGQQTYTIVLDSQPTAEVTVAPASSDPAVTVAPAQLTFDGTNWNVAQEVTVTAVEDDNPANERAEVTHAVSGAGYEDVTVPPLVVSVNDNEEESTGVVLTLAPPTLAESAGATQVVVTGTLNGGTRTVATQVSVSVSPGTAAASDYQARPSGFAMTIPAGTLAGTATFMLTPVDDGIDEFDVTVSLSGTASDGLAVVEAMLTIADDDTRAVTLSETALTVAEPQQTMYTVALDSEPTSEVTVSLSVAQVPMVQLRVSPPVLVFTPQDYAAKTVMVSVRGDADQVGGSVAVSHTVSGGDYGANAVTAESVTVTVTDDVSITSDLAVRLDNETPLQERDAARTLTATVSLLSAAQTVAVTATVTVAGGSATAGRDFRAAPAEFTVTIPAAEREAMATFALTPLDDEIDEDAETVLVRVAAPGLTSDDGVELTIVDDDTRAVTVSETALAIDERDRSMYMVSLGSQPTAEVTVSLSVNAESSVTVQVSPERLVFTPQDYAAKTVVVSARGDADTASGQAVVSHVVSGGDYGENGVTAADVTVTVTDTGSVTSDIGLTLDIVDPLPEGGGARTLVATVELLSGARTDPLAVPLSVAGTGANPAGPEDFQLSPAQLAANFPAGTDTQTVTFMLTPVDDGTVEGDETLLVSAVAPEGSGLDADDGVELTIADDDVREVRVAPTTLAMNERERVTYAMSLGSQPDGEVTVTVTPANTADVELRVSPGELVFTPRNYGEMTVTVFARGDTDELGGDVEIRNSVQGADYGQNNVEASSVTVTVTDNSTVVTDIRVTLDNAAPLPEGGGPRELVATVEKLNPDLENTPVTVDVSVAPGGSNPAQPEDFQAPATFPVTIPVGSLEATATFTLTPVDDGLDEDDETVRVDLTVTSGMHSDGTDLELDDPVDLTIEDDDTRGVAVSPTTLALDEETQGTYAVSLGSQPSAAVTVAVTASGSDSVTAAPSSLVFTTENWDAEQQVTVVAENDMNPNDEIATVAHTVSGGDYEGETAASVTVTVTDDDKPSEEVRLRVTPETVSEGGGPAVLTVTGTLDATPRRDDMTVTLMIRREAMATLTIVAESGSGTATLTLTPTDDDVDRADIEVTIEAMTNAEVTPVGATMPQPMRLVPPTLTVTITDDDDRGVTVAPTEVETSESIDDATYTVVLHSAPDRGESVTVTPTIDAGSPARAVLSVTPSSLTFTMDNWDRAQTLTVLVPDDGNTEPELDATATVTHAISGADYEANGVTAASVAVTVLGFEVMPDGSVQLKVTPDREVTLPGGTPLAEDLEGIVVMLPMRLADDQADGTVSIRGVPEAEIDSRPRGYRVGDSLVDITLGGGETLAAGEKATVCMPTDSRGRRVYHYNDDVSPPEWEELPQPPGGSPNGLACGVTESFSVFALGAAPSDETQGWLARFGRTMASQIVDTVGARLNAPTAGQAQLNLGGSAPQSALLSGAFDVLSGKTVVDAKQALAKSSFVLPLSQGDGGDWTAWGRGAYTEFDGKEGDVDLDGEVVTGTIGMDLSHGDWVAGVAVSHSEGDGDSANEDGDRGEMEISMTSLNPYAKVEMDGGLTAWGVAGYGGGDMKRQRDGVETEVDLDMQLAAAGLEGRVGTIKSEDGAFDLRLKADALAVRMETDAEEADMPDVEADAQRFRLMLSGTGNYPSASGGGLFPTLEAGLRWDEGDAETGMGFELGAGIRFTDAGGHFSTELTARGLVAHEESDYDEWGVGGSVTLGPEHNGRGLSMKLNSGYGPVASETQALWARRDLAGLASEQPVALATRLGLEMGYGFNGPDGRGTWMPYLKYRDEISAELQIGARLDFGEALRLELSALRRREENQGIQFQIEGRW